MIINWYYTIKTKNDFALYATTFIKKSSGLHWRTCPEEGEDCSIGSKRGCYHFMEFTRFSLLNTFKASTKVGKLLSQVYRVKRRICEEVNSIFPKFLFLVCLCNHIKYDTKTIWNNIGILKKNSIINTSRYSLICNFFPVEQIDQFELTLIYTVYTCMLPIKIILNAATNFISHIYIIARVFSMVTLFFTHLL